MQSGTELLDFSGRFDHLYHDVTAQTGRRLSGNVRARLEAQALAAGGRTSIRTGARCPSRGRSCPPPQERDPTCPPPPRRASSRSTRGRSTRNGTEAMTLVQERREAEEEAVQERRRLQEAHDRAEDDAEVTKAMVLANRTRVVERRHIAMLRPRTNEAHATEARLVARSLGIVLDADGDASSTVYWEEVLSIRSKLMARGPQGLNVLNKTTANPLSELAAYLGTGDETARAANNLTYKLEYSLRRFEVNELTTVLQTCGVCTFSAQDHGIFMDASSDFRGTHRARKSVCKARNSSLRCGFEYKWIDTIQHDRSGWECVDVVCSCCVRDLEARR